MCVKYSSSPLGEGKGGSRYTIFKELYYPCNGAMDNGCQAPQTWDVAEQVWGLGWGVQEEKACIGRRIRMGSWGQDAWVSPFPCCRLTSCAVLSFFFFKLEIRAGAGEQGKDLGRACSQVWGLSRETLPATGLAQSPHGKLLINCWLF